MSLELLDRPRGSEALSDYEWRPREPRRPRRRPGGATDITSGARFVEIPFGSATLVLSESPPGWMHELLVRISQLGELEEGWDSYGGRPVDPQCAVATVEFLFSVFDASMPSPSIVPTNRGGIQLEWHCAGADLEIEIESPARLHVSFEDEQAGEETEVTLSGNLEPVVPFLERLKASP